MKSNKGISFTGGGYSKKNNEGIFEVKGEKKQTFNSFAVAKKHYDSLPLPKSFWDVSGIPELIEAQSGKNI